MVGADMDGGSKARPGVGSTPNRGWRHAPAPLGSRVTEPIPIKRRRPVFEFVGWVPAVIIPAATVFGLWNAITTDNPASMGAPSWLLFGIANVCFYIYTEKYRSPQAILGFLGTALLDFAIVAVVLVRGAG